MIRILVKITCQFIILLSISRWTKLISMVNILHKNASYKHLTSKVQKVIKSIPKKSLSGTNKIENKITSSITAGEENSKFDNHRRRKVISTATIKNDSKIESIRAILTEAVTIPEKQRTRFFKTGKGEYSENDKFLGVTMPVLRALCKSTFKNISFEDLTSFTSFRI